MSPPAIRIESLRAGYGDSLLVSCPVGRRTWRLLVDTGPDECWPQLRDRLAQIPFNAQGRRHIDLVVISHIDHDHIGGAGLLFSEKSLKLSFGDVWFNAPPRRTTRGVAEGQNLAWLLGVANSDLPWNLATQGRPLVTSAEGAFLKLPTRRGEPTLTLLSPAPLQLDALFAVWAKELERLRKKQSEAPEPEPKATRGGQGLDLKSLADKPTAVDHAPANGSSIAFLLEHRGASVLLAADAFPTVLAPALHALARERGEEGAFQVDAFKLNHHGSRANVTQDLLASVRADHYIVSTNGALFQHPNDEAIARVILNGGSRPKIWFNYLNERTQRWADPALLERYGYEVGVPRDAAGGVVLELAAARKPANHRRSENQG